MTASRHNVALLAASQALALSAVVLSMTLAGILGATLAPDRGLATLPIAVMVVGTALASIPASMLMRRLGRRAGFMLGAALGVIGSTLAAIGLYRQSFGVFVLGHLLIGAYQGFANYYRFAAAEAAGPAHASRAISWVVAGGVVAAFAGPQLGIWGRDWMARTWRKLCCRCQRWRCCHAWLCVRWWWRLVSRPARCAKSSPSRRCAPRWPVPPWATR
jgi:MFS family permease